MSKLKSDRLTQIEVVLAALIEKFPKAFFKEAANRIPLKVGIHRDLYVALHGQFSNKIVQQSLRRYMGVAGYRKKLVAGAPRIDLEGNPAGEVLEIHVEVGRQHKARINAEKKKLKQERKAAKLAEQAAAAAAASEPAPVESPSGKRPLLSLKKKAGSPAQTSTKNAEHGDLVNGRLEICVKINVFPADCKALKNGDYEFAVDTGEYTVKVILRNKAWGKLKKAASDYPLWVATITGDSVAFSKSGTGFDLRATNIQVFERKPKQEKTKSPEEAT